MKEFTLPSGAILKVQVAPFSDAKALYQTVLEEMKAATLNSGVDLAAIFKDLVCIGFSSRKIEARIDECLKRCLYSVNGVDEKFTKDTFEAVERRDDYITVCLNVTKENIYPFVKSLLSEYKTFLSMTASAQS